MIRSGNCFRDSITCKILETALQSDKQNETKVKKNNKQIIKLWLELSKNSQDFPSTSWLCNKMKCSESEILIPFNITSDEVRVKENVTCYLSGCTGLKDGRCKLSVPVRYLLDMKLFLVVWKSCLHCFCGSCHEKIQKQRRTQKCEKAVKNSWKGREKLVKRPWKTSRGG